MSVGGTDRGLTELAKEQNGYGGSVRVVVDSDNVAVITMDRGENRINDEFVDQMNAALDTVLGNPAVKAVITTSRGKFFCNGLDLEWMYKLRSNHPNHFSVFWKHWTTMMLRFLTLPLPTAAAINGHAFAGGGLLSLCHDYRMMQTDRGWWCFNEAQLGLSFPHWIITLFRVKLLGQGGRPLVEVAVFGKRFTAAEAKDAGIIDDSCGSAELLTGARSFLNRVVPHECISREFVSYTKKQVYENVLATAEIPHHLTSFTAKL